MYALARGPQAAALASRADGEDLGKDRERRLARRRRPEVEPGGAAQPLELVRRDAFLDQALAPPLLRPPRADRPDVEGVPGKRAHDRGHVPALLVREHDHGGSVVRSEPLERLLGPGDDELACARDPLARRKPCPSIRDDRPPAEHLRGAAKLLGEVDRAEDEEQRWRAEHFGEDVLALDLVQPGPSYLAVRREPALARALAVDDGECNLRRFRIGKLVLDALDEDVDLAAARQPDFPRVLVGDPVRDEPRPAARQDLCGLGGDVALDAPAGDRPRQLAALRNRQLRPERARRRPARRNDGRERDGLPFRPPAFDRIKHVAHEAQPSGLSSSSELSRW